MRVPRYLIMATTVVFAIVPATLLVLIAVALGVGGIVALFVREDVVVSNALLAMPVAVAAVLGYVALFRAAWRAVDARNAAWLAAGLAANAYGLYLLESDLSPSALDTVGGWYLFCSPAVVAAAHLVVFLARSGQRAPSA
jgi:hypothetical protein